MAKRNRKKNRQNATNTKLMVQRQAKKKARANANEKYKAKQIAKIKSKSSQLDKQTQSSQLELKDIRRQKREAQNLKFEEEFGSNYNNRSMASLDYEIRKRANRLNAELRQASFWGDDATDYARRYYVNQANFVADMNKKDIDKLVAKGMSLEDAKDMAQDIEHTEFSTTVYTKGLDKNMARVKRKEYLYYLKGLETQGALENWGMMSAKIQKQYNKFMKNHPDQTLTIAEYVDVMNSLGAIGETVVNKYDSENVVDAMKYIRNRRHSTIGRVLEDILANAPEGHDQDYLQRKLFEKLREDL